jgi:hypothetical protein
LRLKVRLAPGGQASYSVFEKTVVTNGKRG